MEEVIVRAGSPCAVSMNSPKVRRVNRVKGWDVFPSFYFPLFLSYKCTRKCPECYPMKQCGDSMEMSDEMFDDLLKFLVKVYNETNERIYHILLLGGEPLLRTDRIKKLVDYIFSNTPGMAFSMFTNGDLIDSVNWSDLTRIPLWNINPTNISIDELARRMDVIKTNADPYNQTVIMYFDEYNMQGTRAEDIAKFCVDNKYRFRISKNINTPNDVEYKARLLKKFHSVLDVLETAQLDGKYVNSVFLIDSVIPYEWGDEALSERFTPYICGKRILSVRPDGSIGPCIRNQTYSVGNIYSDKPYNLIKSNDFIYSYKRPDTPEKCKVCSIRDMCQTGCPYDKLISTGKFDGMSPYCDIYQEILPRVKKIYNYNREHKVKGSRF